MALWLLRPGPRNELYSRFCRDGRVYLWWRDLTPDLGCLSSPEELEAMLRDLCPDMGDQDVREQAREVYLFVFKMRPGDLVIVPRRWRRMVSVGEVTDPYTFDATGDVPFQHFRAVSWMEHEVPPTRVGARCVEGSQVG